MNSDGQAVRIDPSKSNTSDFTYSQQATIISDEAYHGGGDVAVYAIGTPTMSNWKITVRRFRTRKLLSSQLRNFRKESP